MNDFDAARLAGLTHLQERAGIGTLGERSLHAILKYWLDPYETHHEQSVGVGRIIADVFDGQRITEIQTRKLYTLIPKLEKLLPLYPVTVVYPVAHEKRLIWVDPRTGETTPPRKSPKTGRVVDAFHELYALRKLLNHPGLTIRIVLLDMEEYKLRNGWSADGKKGGHRMERIPSALIASVDLHTPEDYKALLPSELPETFTSCELSRLLKVRKGKEAEIANVLYTKGAIIRVGKNRNAFLYSLVESMNDETGI